MMILCSNIFSEIFLSVSHLCEIIIIIRVVFRHNAKNKEKRNKLNQKKELNVKLTPAISSCDYT